MGLDLKLDSREGLKIDLKNNCKGAKITSVRNQTMISPFGSDNNPIQARNQQAQDYWTADSLDWMHQIRAQTRPNPQKAATSLVTQTQSGTASWSNRRMLGPPCGAQGSYKAGHPSQS